ncbi:MAG: hypothetical protein UX89_C0022G0006 [Parcubacteria group bacterium GW2011_GWA2_47_16]|nr:MAG: hypothetical protein UX89_C0022G0006 [Parcubacteria group bacterium GW2011_GWA2_47_16]
MKNRQRKSKPIMTDKKIKRRPPKPKRPPREGYEWRYDSKYGWYEYDLEPVGHDDDYMPWGA